MHNLLRAIIIFYLVLVRFDIVEKPRSKLAHFASVFSVLYVFKRNKLMLTKK